MRLSIVRNSISMLLVGVMVCLSSTGCEKSEELVAPDFKRANEVTAPQKIELDSWIEQELTVPYNIEVIWRWNAKEAGYGYNYVPPKTENVEPYLRILKSSFLETYESVMGKSFIKPLVPKQFLLLGEWGYNQNGSILLGQAESGNKITFLGVNHWNERAQDGSYPWVREAIHTMFHEFGHILHQTKLFSEDFQKISKNYYTGNWSNESELNARMKGFLSNYSMKDHNEDFVEIIAFYITLTPEAFTARSTEALRNYQQWVTSQEDYKSVKKTYDKAKDEYDNAKAIVDNPAASAEDKAKAEKRLKYFDQQLKAGQDQMDALIAAGRKMAEENYVSLQNKITMVKDYLKSSWEIDLDEIRDKALSQMTKVYADPNIFPAEEAQSRSAMSSLVIMSPFTHHLITCDHAGLRSVGATPEGSERLQK